MDTEKKENHYLERNESINTSLFMFFPPFTQLLYPFASAQTHSLLIKHPSEKAKACSHSFRIQKIKAKKKL